MKLRFPCRALLALLLLLAAGTAAGSGCATVRLVGSYDEQIDAAGSRLQKQMDSVLTRIESLPPGDAGRAFAPNRQFYLNYGVDLRALEARAAGIPANRRTVEQLQLLQQSLQELQSVHAQQDGLSNAAIGEYRTLFNTHWQAILALELAKKRS